MSKRSILRTAGQFQLFEEDGQYFIENTILTRFTEDGISYPFSAEKKEEFMRMGKYDFVEIAKTRAGNDITRIEVAKGLWQKLGDIPVNEDEEIEQEWNTGVGKYFFDGTHREDIWHWFEEFFDLSVAEDLMFAS